MELIRFIVRYSRRTAVLAILAGIIGGASSTALLAVINAALRDPANAVHSSLVWIFGGLCILLPLMRFFSEYLLLRLGQDALFEVRLQLSRQILGSPLRRLEELGAGRLLATLTDDVPVITNALLNIPIISINIAVVVCSLVYLGWLSLPVLVAVLAFMALGVAGYQLPVAKATVYLRRARDHMDALLIHFRALTEGTKELKLHRQRREAFLSEVRTTASTFRRETVTGYSIYLAAASWGQTMGFIAVGLLVFVLPSIYGTNLQVLTGYVIVILFMMTPLQLVMNMMAGLSRANIAISRLDQLGLTLRGYQAEPETEQERGRIGKLELIGVTHGYRRETEESTFTLGPIDLSFHRGELVFLVGGNGSGKTTLAKLLVGLYAPESGEIRLNGATITDADRDAYRQMFSVVFSDFYLFESLLGIEDQQLDQRAQSYLQLLQLAHKVGVKDSVLTTTQLSQGQRKRLALLTAYLEDRSFYVFDEWAADQDPLFKEVFYLQILPELRAKGKTVLVISHDDRYYHVADRIIKLDYGRIAFDEDYAGVELTASGVVVS
jgi:putative pyoverdin transport system ATP-binding/permease protein